MMSLNLATRTAIAAIALGLSAQPVLADTKAGVDAWTNGDYALAVKEWRASALKGDADAQYNLGYAYQTGKGVPTDMNIALDWYRKAAAQNHWRAADGIGHILHYQGKVADALPQLQISADRGDPRAQYLLGVELFNGRYVGKDWVKAYAYMTRASAAGLVPASRGLAQMDQHIPLDQRQQGVALAGQLEQRAGKARNDAIAGFDIDTKPSVAVAKPVGVPPSKPAPKTAAPGFPGDVPPMDAPPPKPRPAPVAQPAPVKVATPAPVATGGNWRIQLGAFSNDASAEKLWNSLEAKIGDLASLTPYLKEAVTDKGATITRLQAGPFSNRASAEAMCGKVKATGQACIVAAN